MKLSRDAVKTVILTRVRQGYSAAVAALLRQLGAASLADVQPGDYEALVRAAEEIDLGC